MSEAYKWLHTLPPSVREEMKSMEQVVNLYLRTKRLGQTVPSKEDLDNFRPATPTPNPQEQKSVEFQKTLKSLRTELDGFDFVNHQGEAQQSAPVGQSTSQINNQGSKSTISAFQTHGQAVSHSVTHSTSQAGGPAQQATPMASQQNQLPPIPQSDPSPTLRMDPRSRQIVNEIREALNLSSDAEVLRMSLVLAKKALQHIL